MSDATLMARCSRPKCRSEFPLSISTGRPQTYCSTNCRSESEKEYRAALSLVAHYERLAVQARLDLATFGRGSSGITPAKGCQCDYKLGDSGEWERVPGGSTGPRCERHFLDSPGNDDWTSSEMAGEWKGTHWRGRDE